MKQTDVTHAPQSGTESEIVSVAHDIAVAARRMSGEIESARRLPEELVALLRDSGLLRAGMPAEVGGLELAPGLALECAEEVARGDASAGWCVSIAITSSLLVALSAAQQSQRTLRRRTRCRRGCVGAARHGTVGARRRCGVGTLAVL